MHFYPKKAAFRVGDVNGAFWNDSNIGNYSIAMGGSTIASGAVSTAIGNSTAATGINSTSMGFFTVASGANSTSLGYSTIASGYNSFAMGRGIEAQGEYSVAIALSDQNGKIIDQNNTMSIMGGYVGIDEVSPGFPLHINSNLKPWGTNHAHHIKLEVLNGWWTIGVDDQEGDADLVFRSNEDTDGFTAYIDPESGNMAITSDIRYKKNIEPLSNILNEIEKLEPVSYLLLQQDNNARKELGFIAQDVNEIFPKFKIAKQKNEYWSLFYNNFGTIAIAGIKELKVEKDKEIEELKEAISQLLNRIEVLESNL